MMIDKYISDLLYRYQCVTIPGFGAFITEIASAQVSGSASTFLPPRKLVSFNPNIKNNDGLLAHHIAQQEKISFEKATEVIAQKAAFWTGELQQRNSVSFPNVGTINAMGEELNCVFTPVNSVNYLTSSFGLTSFVSPEIKREVIKSLEEQPVIAKITAEPKIVETWISGGNGRGCWRHRFTKGKYFTSTFLEEWIFSFQGKFYCRSDESNSQMV